MAKNYNTNQLNIKVGVIHGDTGSGYVPIRVNSEGAMLVSPTTGSSQWDDIRFPFSGRKLDVVNGRLDYNYTELGVDYAANTRVHRYDQLGFICQLQHDWQLGTPIRPHLHWFQNKSTMPNFLLDYRVTANGDESNASFTRVKYITNAFTYPTGKTRFLQITTFPEIDMSSYTDKHDVSIIIDFKLYRDSANTSGLFSGADGYGVVTTKEFDVHYKRDSNGSRLEYEK